MQTHAQLVEALRNARAAFISAQLRGSEIMLREKPGSRAALAGLEMRNYAESGQKDIDAVLNALGETA